MVTISATESRITVLGCYKEFTGNSDATEPFLDKSTILFTAGDTLDNTTEVGRFLMWMNKPSALEDTGDWEIRRIESISVYPFGTFVAVDEEFSDYPPVGSKFRISSNLQDIANAVNADTNVTPIVVNGDSHYWGARDWNMGTNINDSDDTAFLADVDKSLYTESGVALGWPMVNKSVIQFGMLTGGEANNSTETTKGCRITMKSTLDASGSAITSVNALVKHGPMLNLYGCLVESSTLPTSPGSAGWRFIRAGGPMRMIGTIWDGSIAGRFYHPASEWADCRMSGSDEKITSWSLGATFTRSINNVKFFDSVAAVKSHLNFSGEFRDTNFSLSSVVGVSGIFMMQGNDGSYMKFIDCTTFDTGDVIFQGRGTLDQLKSINYTLTDADGLKLEDAKGAVYDKNSAIQSSISSTSVSGELPEILASLTKLVKVGGSQFEIVPFVGNGPFDIRIRKYGYVYQDFQSAVDAPIKQEYRLPTNTVVALTKFQALTQQGIAVDFTQETITVTEDKTLSQIYDYCQAFLQGDLQMSNIEPLKSTDGLTFTLNPNWGMVLGSGGKISSAAGKTLSVSGAGYLKLFAADNVIDGLTVQGAVISDVVLNKSIDNVTITGGLTFTVAGEWTLKDSNVNEILNTSNSNVTLNTLLIGIGLNTGPDITIVKVPTELAFTGLKPNTEVRVYEAGTTTEVDGTGIENVNETGLVSFDIPIDSVDIVIHSLGFLNQRLEAVDTTKDLTLPITQILDRQYNNPA